MFGQLVALNLLFLFNPFLPGVSKRSILLLFSSVPTAIYIAVSEAVSIPGFQNWSAPLLLWQIGMPWGAVHRFLRHSLISPVSQSLLLLSGEVEQPQVSKALEACSVWIVAILPEGTQGRKGENTFFFPLSFALSVEEVCSWQGSTVHRLDWCGHGAECPNPLARMLGNTRQLWRTKWMARVEDKNWLHGLVAFNFLVLSLPHPSSLLREMSHLLPPSQAVRAAQQIWAHSSFPVLQHSPYIYSTTIQWLLVERVLCFNLKSDITRTGRSTV